MKRIIILSDSLGRARPDIQLKDRTRYCDTYGYILQKVLINKYIVEICYIESLDSIDAIFWNQRMVAFREPDIVIYHIGINDCAPRLFKKNSSALILKPFFRKFTCDLFLRILSYYRSFFTKLVRKVYVDKKTFKENIKTMIQEVKKYNPNCKFFCITIAMGDELYVKKSPDINKNIREYNKILKDCFSGRCIDINEIVKLNDMHISDGVHLSKKAHKQLAEHLLKILENEFKNGSK